MPTRSGYSRPAPSRAPLLRLLLPLGVLRLLLVAGTLGHRQQLDRLEQMADAG